MFSGICPYQPLLFSHFVFLFSLSFSFSSRYGHILQFTMFNTNSLQPARNITEIKKCFIVHYQVKRFLLIITNPMLQYLRETKYEFFLPPYQITFFLALIRLMLSHHILMKILTLRRKDLLIILPTESFR